MSSIIFGIFLLLLPAPNPRFSQSLLNTGFQEKILKIT